MSNQRFGISTHLFHETRLTREHLTDVAGHGFEAVEVFATRTHFDYHDAYAAAALGEWLSDLGLEFHSMHAPIVEAIRRGTWVGSFSIASSDEARRRLAVAEAQAALKVAETLPYKYLVVHLGIPNGQSLPAGDNEPAAARRSIEELVTFADAVNVRVAIELIPNTLSSPSAICGLIEDGLDGIDVGICLDYGHANIMGDVADAIETVGEHVWTTHLHDNDGKRDEHAVPFAGRIDWGAAMMETQRIGYDGVLMFEVADAGNPMDVLKQTARARTRLEQMLVTF